MDTTNRTCHRVTPGSRAHEILEDFKARTIKAHELRAEWGRAHRVKGYVGTPNGPVFHLEALGPGWKAVKGSSLPNRARYQFEPGDLLAKIDTGTPEGRTMRDEWNAMPSRPSVTLDLTFALGFSIVQTAAGHVGIAADCVAGRWWIFTHNEQALEGDQPAPDNPPGPPDEIKAGLTAVPWSAYFLAKEAAQ